jgi:hypothetical protein
MPQHPLSSPPPSDRPASRGRWLGWLALALLLATALPLYLRLPLFSDLIQYDLSARVVLKGGIPYRDVFDTNLPGMVWVHMAVRSLFGWSSEAFRLADLAVISAIVWLLVGWLRRLGRSAATLLWAAVLLYGFYFSTSEWVQGQRDTWMLLPALLALGLRRRQLEYLLTQLPKQGSDSCRTALQSRPDGSGEPSYGTSVLAGRALLEGVCWGAAFWIKPFVAVPGLSCWLLSAVLVWRASGPRRGRLLALDAVALLGGGLLSGVLGILWLVESGAWPHFWHIMTNVNREYYAATHDVTLAGHLQYVLQQFFPWTLVYAVSLPLAGRAVWGLAAAANLPRAALPTFSHKLLLSGFFLGWLFQAAFLQVAHEYVLAPPILLGWTLLLALAPPRPPRLLAWALLLVFVGLAVWRHPLARWDRLSLWGRCWTEASPELRNRLQLTHISHTPDWVALQEVADFLRRQELSDGELTCCNGSALSLYLDLDVKPPTPFVHFDMLFRYFPGHVEEVRDQLNASPQRFVVTDLQYARNVWGRPLEVPADTPLALPRDFPEEWARHYPWSEPMVFRSGRYLVHRVTGPVKEL